MAMEKGNGIGINKMGNQKKIIVRVTGTYVTTNIEANDLHEAKKLAKEWAFSFCGLPPNSKLIVNEITPFTETY